MRRAGYAILSVVLAFTIGCWDPGGSIDDHGSKSGDGGTTGSGSGGGTGGGGTGGGGGGTGGGGGGGGGGNTGGGVGTGGSGGTAGTFDKSTVVNGVTRNYDLYVPNSAMSATGPVPLVMAFHGAGDTAANFITATGLTANASSNGYILVGLDAYPGTGGTQGWFLSTAQGWPGPGSNSYPNDFAFVLQCKDEIGQLYNIDTKRIFACGFSRGAGFTGMMATASGNPAVQSGSFNSPFAAYGICAGYDVWGGGVNFQNSNPKRPCWLIHGTADGAVPYSEGQSFANALQAAGFPTTFTTVDNAPHNWLWAPQFGHSNQELYDWFQANPLP